MILINSREDRTPLGPFDFAALAFWILGFAVEFSADTQKFVFRSDPNNREKFITTGIWAYSRHPNYFGEILMWAALALSTSFTRDIKGHANPFFAWLSPVFTAFLLLFVSGVTMVEHAGNEKWGHLPEYQHYMKNTSCLIPWFPAKAEIDDDYERAKEQ